MICWSLNLGRHPLRHLPHHHRLYLPLTSYHTKTQPKHPRTKHTNDHQRLRCVRCCCCCNNNRCCLSSSQTQTPHKHHKHHTTTNITNTYHHRSRQRLQLARPRHTHFVRVVAVVVITTVVVSLPRLFVVSPSPLLSLFGVGDLFRLLFVVLLVRVLVVGQIHHYYVIFSEWRFFLKKK